jgi:chemotaxis protein CheZ
MRDGIAIPQSNATSADQTATQNSSEVEAVRAQIGQMVMTIDKTKREIAAIKHPLGSDDPVETASTQLDAIVDATEGATEDILDATEKVEDLVKRIVATDPDNGDLVGLGEEIGGHLVRVMEACSFQDITGQRVTKVVNTLSFIEERVAAIIGIWGPAAFECIPIDPTQPDEEKSDEQLLNGPQLANEGISQDDIDALFD